MKSILIIDVPVLDDGRHLCNECPIWNKERFFCEYDFNMETKGCSLKPIPDYLSTPYLFRQMQIADGLQNEDGSVPVYTEDYQKGWNDCLEEILGDYE